MLHVRARERYPPEAIQDRRVQWCLIVMHGIRAGKFSKGEEKSAAEIASKFLFYLPQQGEWLPPVSMEDMGIQLPLRPPIPAEFMDGYGELGCTGCPQTRIFSVSSSIVPWRIGANTFDKNSYVLARRSGRRTMNRESSRCQRVSGFRTLRDFDRGLLELQKIRTCGSEEMELIPQACRTHEC